MSADPHERELRNAREDNRNELAQARKRSRELEAHEAELRRVENDRWWRRISALMPSYEPVESDDFEGATE